MLGGVLGALKTVACAFRWLYEGPGRFGGTSRDVPGSVWGGSKRAGKGSGEPLGVPKSLICEGPVRVPLGPMGVRVHPRGRFVVYSYVRHLQCVFPSVVFTSWTFFH